MSLITVACGGLGNPLPYRPPWGSPQKDAMSLDILQGLEAVGISIASATFEIASLPPLHIREGTLGGPVIALLEKQAGRPQG